VRLRETVSLSLTYVAMLAAILLVGGALRWTGMVVAGFVAAALLVQVFARRQLDRPSPILVLLGLAILFTLLQLVPLPTSIISALDPVHADLRASGARLAGTTVWHCISMDPPGTLRALAFFVTLLGFALLGLRFSASDRGRYLIVAGVTVACGLAAAVTGIHVLVSATSLYGIYEPAHAAPPILGPLLNPNHLGCLGAIGGTLGVGLTFQERQPAQLRALWLVIALGCTLMVIGSGSRGATLGLGLGLFTTLSLLAGQYLTLKGSRSRRRSLARDLPIVAVILVGVAVAVFAAGGKVVDDFDRTDLSDVEHPLSKFQAWSSSLQLVEDSPWVGVGRGAVEPALTRVHPATAYASFSHLENEYLSAVVEWGIPAALLLAAALGWCVVAGARRWRESALAASALGAIAAVMFQSTVDFGIELLGIAVPCTLLATTLLMVPFRSVANPTRTRALRIGLVIAVVGAALPLLFSITTSVSEDHEAMADARSRDDVNAAIQRHPLDYFGFATMGEVLLRTGNPDAVDFLNHALALHPTQPGLHRLAGRLLVANHRVEQAALEYSLAVQNSIAVKPVITEILAQLTDPEMAARAIPADLDPPDSVLHILDEAKRNDVAVRWLLHAIERPDVPLSTIDLLYDLATSRRDVAAARKAADRRVALAHTYTSRLKLASVELSQHDLAPVVADLADVTKWTGRSDEKGQAWLILCDAYAEQGALDRALSCLHELDGTGLLFSQRSDILRRIRSVEGQRTTQVLMESLQGSSAK
jgi:O-antigen ligase